MSRICQALLISISNLYKGSVRQPHHLHKYQKPLRYHRYLLPMRCLLPGCLVLIKLVALRGDDKSIKKSVGLKTRKLKGLKLSKSGISKSKKLAQSKKLSKSENSLNFDAKKIGPSFLIPEAKVIFNCLRLAFTKALIF